MSCTPQFPLFWACICYFSNGKEHVEHCCKYWTVFWAVSHLWGYGLPTKVGTLWIQALCHLPEFARLHCPIWKAIRWYPLRNCPIDPIVGLRISPIGRGSKGASHEGNVADGFLLHCRWSWQLVDREGFPTGLTYRSKGGSYCNVLGNTNTVGQNVSCHVGPWIVMVGNQGAADTTLNFQHAVPLLIWRFHTERVTWPSWVVFKQHPQDWWLAPSPSFVIWISAVRRPLPRPPPSPNNNNRNITNNSRLGRSPLPPPIAPGLCT